MAEEKTAPTNSSYLPGLAVGLVAGAALFWLTMQLLIAVR